MRIFQLVLVSILFLLCSCSKSGDRSFNAEPAMEAVADSRSDAGQKMKEEVNGQALQVTAPKLIKEGEMRIETADVSKLRKALLDELAKVKGYCEQDEGNTSEGRTEHTLMLRIPAERYDDFLKMVTQTGGRIESKNIRTLDVTEEYIDIQARLNTKKALEARYLQLLQKASRIEDILKIEKELADQHSEIESIQGRLNFLDKRIAYSTLRITFYQTSPYRYPFFNRIGDALTEGWNLFLGFIVLLFRLWPFMLGLILFWLLIRWWRRR